MAWSLLVPHPLPPIHLLKHFAIITWIALAPQVVVFSAETLVPADWPAWRGPRADVVSDGRGLPIEWSQTNNVRWSADLPGWETNSPVIHDEHVYITSEVATDNGKSLLTVCHDRESGRKLWRHDFGYGVNQRTHAKSNLVVNTPVVTNDALYVACGTSVKRSCTYNQSLFIECDWIEVVARDGIEPPTRGFSIPCSTN